MFTILLIAFFSGILTVLAPCVLPLLPVILGGSLAGKSRARPYIIIASLIISLLLFTVLLKISTVLIGVDPIVWEYASGGLLILFSITLIFPSVWAWVMDITGIEKLSQNSLENAGHKEGIWWPIALGAALGPVFSSCNPTYTILLATILPASISMGLAGLAAYFLGLGIILLLVVYFGRSIIGRFAFFANPNGLFRRGLGVIILIIGILIVTGSIKDLEAYVIEKNIFIDTATIDNTFNDIILKNHNDQNGSCTNGKCDATKEGALNMDLQKAPEITGIGAWINSDPLTLASLKWKVVLIDFWTYSCINCQRTQPYLNAWYDKYEKDGLVIIGVHAPEFAFEKVETNVRQAVQKAGIKYPVALDNNFKTWNAYGNRFWPAKYLIDKNGNIVYTHFGEGKYDEVEANIQRLLGEKDSMVSVKTDTTTNKTMTPETYLGSSRAMNMVFQAGKFVNGSSVFEAKYPLEINQWTLQAGWKISNEYIEALPEIKSAPNYSLWLSHIRLRFSAKKVFLVVSSESRNWTISIDTLKKDGSTESTKDITFKGDDLYTVFESDQFQPDTTIIISASAWLRFHAFTFWG